MKHASSSCSWTKSRAVATAFLLSFGVFVLTAQIPTGGDQYIGPPGTGTVPGLAPNPPAPSSAAPVNFTVLPVAVSARVSTQREVNGKIVHSWLKGSVLLNLALGQPATATLPASHILALAIGDDLAATHRLIVFDTLTSTQVKVIASGQLAEVLKNGAQSLGLLNFTFLPTGNDTDGIRGGSAQVVAQTNPWSRASAIFGNGNGRLEFTRDGVAGSAILHAFALRAGSKAIGTLTE